MENIEELQSQITGLLAITQSQTETLKGLNENCWLLLERIQSIESKIETLQYGKIKTIEEQELDGFILSDLINAEK